MKKSFFLIIIILISVFSAYAARRAPWRIRYNKNVETFHITAHKNTPSDLWPEEPDSPVSVEQSKFTAALGRLCTDTSNERVLKYSLWILKYSARFDIDPFLLASLVYDQSSCRPVAFKRYEERGLFGLTHFPLLMHARHYKKGSYIWYQKESDKWSRQELELDVPLNRSKVRRAETNIYLSAAILSVLKQQRPSLVLTFPENGAYGHSRHYISNWFYGDWIRTPEPENRVLTARRRMLAYYNSVSPAAAAGKYHDITLVSPLDGTPRLVIDYFGNKRGHKDGYGHRGIDIDGTVGEPVRAVADGIVVFAGMDLHGELKHMRMTPAEAENMDSADIPQGGGFYVMINHGSDFGTVYMHLDSFCVEYRQQVKAGDIIGTLGKSGSIKSGPHLHLEFREKTYRIDPAEYLSNILINPY
jgi:murein DD-endopeptidase MepM/ murein hydrolase activator NlpD